MLYHDFIKCLTSGTWRLRGHVYHFLSPALLKHGYFSLDGVTDTDLTFEVAFENGDLYLYLNVDRESVPGERYRVLGNYCDETMTMIHEILKGDETGYEDPTEVIFEKNLEPVKTVRKSLVFKIAENLHRLVRRASSLRPQTASN